MHSCSLSDQGRESQRTRERDSRVEREGGKEGEGVRRAEAITVQHLQCNKEAWQVLQCSIAWISSRALSAIHSDCQTNYCLAGSSAQTVNDHKILCKLICITNKLQHTLNMSNNKVKFNNL